MYVFEVFYQCAVSVQSLIRLKVVPSKLWV